MNATELFKAGRLADAIEAQTQEVKANPTDPNRRVFLFELLVFAGDLDRARRQLEAVQYDEPDRMTALQRYRRLVDSEQNRRATFTQGQAVSFLTEVPFNFRMRLDAIRNMLPHEGVGEAKTMIEGARGMTPNLKVLLNDKEYDGLIDADDLFGTALEVMVNGLYYWVPLENVASLAMNDPQYPRDLIWFPARIELTDGQTGEVYLPTLYPGTHLHPDEQVKLGRTTDWKTLEEGLTVGVGQKTYLAGEEAVGILEWRELRVLGEVS
jgi:type VI secretion system protein ImpE